MSFVECRPPRGVRLWWVISRLAINEGRGVGGGVVWGFPSGK